MLTTLDAKPQEWMQGDPAVLHTVAACHFKSPEHAEHWINALMCSEKQEWRLREVGWRAAKGRHSFGNAFIAACVAHAHELDLSLTCVSSSEGKMSWFAWAFYFPNRHLIAQRTDAKGPSWPA